MTGAVALSRSGDVVNIRAGDKVGVAEAKKGVGEPGSLLGVAVLDVDMEVERVLEASGDSVLKTLVPEEGLSERVPTSEDGEAGSGLGDVQGVETEVVDRSVELDGDRERELEPLALRELEEEREEERETCALSEFNGVREGEREPLVLRENNGV